MELLRYYKYKSLPQSQFLNTTAKRLRSIYNPIFDSLWRNLQNPKISHNFDIERQVVIDDIIVDFFIPELGIVIILSGNDPVYKTTYQSKDIGKLKNYDLQVLIIEMEKIRTNLSQLYDSISKSIMDRLFFFIFMDCTIPNYNIVKKSIKLVLYLPITLRY